MGKVTPNPLLPPLRVADFAGRDALVCRVKRVALNVPSAQGKGGRATFMELWEFPGKGLYLNATSLEAAVAGFGSDETDNWADKSVPVVVVQAEYEDRITKVKTVRPNLWVAPAEEWKKLLKTAPKAPKVDSE